MTNIVYIGNLPHNIEKNELESLFSLCGPIVHSQVIKYDDHTYNERAYGFLEFQEYEGAQRAYFFHKKAYEGLLINVRPANSVQYGTYLPGIPYNVTKEQILASLQQMFGDKFYPNIHYPGKGFVMVNFKDDQTRHQYINTTRPLFSSSGRPQIKEFKKEVPVNQSEEFVEVVILKIPGGTTEQEVEKKFQLCGLTTITMSNSDNYYVCATIRMSRSGFETAKMFNGLEIEWDTKLTYPVPMQVMLKEQHDNEWREYGNTVLLKNYDPTMPLKEIEEKFFKSFGPDSVRVLRGNKKKTFLYVNIKEKSAMDKILAKSGEIYFGGAEPATFEPHLQGVNVKPAPSRMKPTQSLQSIGTPRNISSFPSIGTPRNVSAKTSTGSPWELVVKNADCGMDAVKALFEQIGTVGSFAYMASDNSYHIKLTPKF